MAISNYTELQAAVGHWLNRTDMTDRIPEFIALAEGTLNKVLRDTRMVMTASIAITSPFRRGAVPADFIAPAYAEVGAYPLEQVSPDQLVLERRRSLKPGAPRFFALVGRNVEIVPSPAANTTIDLSYYATLPPLAANSTNWLLTYDSDIYLYTALMHAAAYLQDVARTDSFKGLVSEGVSVLIQTSQTANLEALRQPGASLTSRTDPARPQ